MLTYHLNYFITLDSKNLDLVISNNFYFSNVLPLVVA